MPVDCARRRRSIGAGFSACFALLLACAGGVAAQGRLDPGAGARAWQELAAGRFDAAAAAFRDALAAEPRNARLHAGAATAAFARRRDAEARLAAERALALDPDQPEARAVLGRVLYRAGDIHTAVRLFEGLAAGGHGGRALTATLDRWRREAALRDRMHVAVGAGVTVEFEGPDDAALAERAIASLERAASRIGSVLSHHPITPIAVVLYTNEQFRDITRAPEWAAGAFDGTIRIPMRGALADLEELDRVLAHEYTHALVHDLARRGVPQWLHEGLAVVFEQEEPLASRPAFAALAAPGERRTGRVPLDRLGGSFASLPGDAAALAYGVSAVAAQRLLDDAGGFAVANLLRDLGEGTAFDAAFERRIQRSLGDFADSLALP